MKSTHPLCRDVADLALFIDEWFHCSFRDELIKGFLDLFAGDYLYTRYPSLLDHAALAYRREA
jgi:hypothetical protein